MTWEDEDGCAQCGPLLPQRTAHVSGQRLAETCRHCGKEPVWPGNTFCGLCKHSLHEQVKAYLSQF